MPRAVIWRFSRAWTLALRGFRLLLCFSIIAQVSVDLPSPTVTRNGAGLTVVIGLQPGRNLPGVFTFSLYESFNLQSSLDVENFLKLGQVPISSFPYSGCGQVLKSSGMAPGVQPLKKSA